MNQMIYHITEELNGFVYHYIPDRFDPFPPKFDSYPIESEILDESGNTLATVNGTVYIAYGATDTEQDEAYARAHEWINQRFIEEMSNFNQRYYGWRF